MLLGGALLGERQAAACLRCWCWMQTQTQAHHDACCNCSSCWWSSPGKDKREAYSMPERISWQPHDQLTWCTQGLACKYQLYPEVAASKAAYWQALAAPTTAMAASARHLHSLLQAGTQVRCTRSSHNTLPGCSVWCHITLAAACAVSCLIRQAGLC